MTEWQAFAALEAEGHLKIRIHHLLQPANLEDAAVMGLKPGCGSNRLWVGHLKLFADGSLGSGTALLHTPYCDEPDNLTTDDDSTVTFGLSLLCLGHFGVSD